jgi:DNA primase
MGMAGVETTLFNVESLFKASNYICICEGELDTITMATKTKHPAIGAPGAHAWKSHYTRVLEDFDIVLILADGDEAGLEFGKKIQRAIPNGRILQMPEGEDVNSVVLKKGTEYLDERIRAAI